jgi:DNA-binding transcriptional LysR family regulator
LETAGRDGKEPRVPVFRANSVVALKYAIRAGIGLGLIPDYLTEEETELVPVLSDVQLPTMQIIFVYPEEVKTAKKIQVLRDFLVATARQWKS